MPPSRKAKHVAAPSSPFLTQLSLREERREANAYPFGIPLFAKPFTLDVKRPVTFLVGENGSGKSTLLEAIASATGFNVAGGGRDHRFGDEGEGSALGNALRLGWSRKVQNGFFFRAETFFDFVSYLETTGGSSRTGPVSLHHMSHGEAFLSLFQDRFQEGLYLLDEPEAALSPQRQLAFLEMLHDMSRRRVAQFIIATHSPMLTALPGATVLALGDGVIEEVAYTETEHFRLTRDFLNAPERYFRHLLAEGDEA